MEQDIYTVRHVLALVSLALFALAAALHALLNKRDPRSAFGWVALCLFFPFAGPVLYWVFGMNRIRTRARRLELERPRVLGETAALDTDASDGPAEVPVGDPAGEVHAVEPDSLPGACARIGRVSDALTAMRLVPGNSVRALDGGEQAFPAMLEAIDSSQRSVALTTYIFQHDAVGEQFIDTLARAHERGVDVRVIIDGIGELYSFPKLARRTLVKRGVRVERFLAPRLLPPSLYINLRTHHKLLVVDGEIAFTGGMNLSQRHLALSPAPPARAADMHFELRGPVVSQLEQSFRDDWRFCARDHRRRAFASVWPGARRAGTGNATCRVVVDGPNDSLDSLSMLLVAAMAAAEHRITILTPYFLPSREMVAALQTAALRGVEVNVVLPLRSNMRYVDWATAKVLPELLHRGVRVYLQPPPFAHTKLFLVDGVYSLIGSANMDPRSLRLNFELMVEVHCAETGASLSRYAQGICDRSSIVTLTQLDARSMAVKARDGVAWLFSPYL